jgi:hypothetical protein
MNTHSKRKEPFMQKLGFCGDDCSVCPRYLATQSGDAGQFRKVADLWHRVGYRDTIMPKDDLACHGCSRRTRCDRMAVRECAVEKGVENCGKCENYPCEKILQTFEETELFAKSAKDKCSKEEYKVLQKAFYEKRKNLDKINKEWLSQKKKA